jgi:hypothetical protein
MKNFIKEASMMTKVTVQRVSPLFPSKLATSTPFQIWFNTLTPEEKALVRPLLNHNMVIDLYFVNQKGEEVIKKANVGNTNPENTKAFLKCVKAFDPFLSDQIKLGEEFMVNIDREEPGWVQLKGDVIYLENDRDIYENSQPEVKRTRINSGNIQLLRKSVADDEGVSFNVIANNNGLILKFPEAVKIMLKNQIASFAVLLKNGTMLIGKLSRQGSTLYIPYKDIPAHLLSMIPQVGQPLELTGELEPIDIFVMRSLK